MKKFLSLILALALCLGLSVPATAVEGNEKENLNTQTSETILSQIDVFLDIPNDAGISTYSADCESDAIEYKLSDEERSNLADNPIFSGILQNTQSRLERGEPIKELHYEMPVGFDISMLATDDWKSHTYALRTYNGFEFRYLDSYVAFNTNWENYDTIGKVLWTDLLKQGLIMLVTKAGAVGKAVGIAMNFNSVLDTGSVRPNVNYTRSKDYYIKYKADGRHYERQFYMSDKDNRVSGLDYYLPGTSQKINITNKVDVVAPSKTANPISYAGNLSTRNIQKDSYTGTNAIFDKFITCYYTAGNSTYHDEYSLRDEIITVMRADDISERYELK